jgi:FdhE protein
MTIMNKSLEKTKEQIKRLREKNPVYKELLDFYGRIAEEMFIVNPQPDPPSLLTKEEVRKIQIKEGFPLINRNDFVIDIPASVKLFESVSSIAKNATTKLKKNIQKIDNAVKAGKLKREKLLEKHYDPAYIQEVAKKLKLDKAVLNFLIHVSIKPSVHANAERLRDQTDLKNWLRGYCPVCGSLPLISEFKDNGQRYFLCSFCDFQWPGERLKCPFCENTDHKKLHYLYAEGQEAYRVDLCDKCKQYIKTVDSRKLDYEPDLALEDITTIHLDIIASEKGFKRPVASLWGV